MEETKRLALECLMLTMSNLREKIKTADCADNILTLCRSMDVLAEAFRKIGG